MTGTDDSIRAAFGPDVAADLPPTVDEAAVRRLQRIAHVLDELVRIPGINFRFGLDPVLGTIPVVGNALSAGVSLYIVFESARLGVSYTTLLRMLANVGLETAVGSVPLVGTVFNAVWKVNKRNLRLALADVTDGALDLDELAGDAETSHPETTADDAETDGPVVIEVEPDSE